MTIQELKLRKQALGLTNERVAELSGLPLSTVQKIFAGITKSPRESTLCTLERTLLKEEIERKTEYAHEFYDQASFVGETNLLDLYDRYWGTLDPFEPRPDDVKEPVKSQGEYTLLDYYAMPPDRRVELIDGVIYDMAAPSRQHQIIISIILSKLTSYILENDLPCTPIASPIDVRLDRDDKTMLQPDILVICSHNNPASDSSETESNEAADEASPDDTVNQNVMHDTRYINGAPDFVVEVLSPTTKKKDTEVKLRKYIDAGVKEYWMINPDKEYVVVQGQDEKIINVYSFNDKVPVGMTNGDLMIDFTEVRTLIQKFMENSQRLMQ